MLGYALLYALRNTSFRMLCEARVLPDTLHYVVKVSKKCNFRTVIKSTLVLWAPGTGKVRLQILLALLKNISFLSSHVL